MILKALADYYDQLLAHHAEGVEPLGWTNRGIAALVVIGELGELIGIIPAEDKKGRLTKIPAQVKRSSGVAPNFACDTCAYLFGFDAKANQKRAQKCFEAARDLYHEVLDGVDSPVAKALLAFYESWDVDTASNDEVIRQNYDCVTGGGFLAFVVQLEGRYVLPADDEAVAVAWERHYFASDETSVEMRCLVTGHKAAAARLHPTIRGVYGAQSMGASLVSFNERAGESYGHVEEQGRNAPVSERAALAYGAALNYLLSHPDHHIRLGDVTIVYWSGESETERADEHNCHTAALCLGGIVLQGNKQERQDQQKKLDAAVQAIVQGKQRDDAGLDFKAPFYVLGIAPNAARLSVNFFLQSTFGDFIHHIAAHYQRLQLELGSTIPRPLYPYRILAEIENPDAKNKIYSSPLAAPLMRAIIADSYYPDELFQLALQRMRATQNDDEENVWKVDYGRTAIIKAYLLRNRKKYKEEITVGLNENSTNQAYNLGRAFCALEQIQRRANDSANIANRYMNSASTTPALVFPELLSLANAHLNKMDQKARWFYRNNLAQILDTISDDGFPKRLSLEEQGMFFLGYYQQLNHNIKQAQANKNARTAEEE